MRKLLILLALVSAPALADPIGDASLWRQLLPVATEANARLTAIRTSCVPPMCNPGLLAAEIEQQHAAALARCPALYAGSPSQTELCVQFENVVFQ